MRLGNKSSSAAAVRRTYGLQPGALVLALGVIKKQHAPIESNRWSKSPTVEFALRVTLNIENISD